MLDKLEVMKKGALVAQAPNHLHSIAELNDNDLVVLDYEKNYKLQMAPAIHTLLSHRHVCSWRGHARHG